MGPGGCLAFWVPEMQGGRAAAGLVVLAVAARAPGRWAAGDGWAAEIRRYLISH